MSVPGCDGARRLGAAMPVLTPADDPAVSAYGTRVPLGACDEYIGARRWCRLAFHVSAPALDRLVGAEAARIAVTSAQGRERTVRGFALTIEVVSPAFRRQVGSKSAGMSTAGTDCRKCILRCVGRPVKRAAPAHDLSIRAKAAGVIEASGHRSELLMKRRLGFAAVVCSPADSVSVFEHATGMARTTTSGGETVTRRVCLPVLVGAPARHGTIRTPCARMSTPDRDRLKRLVGRARLAEEVPAPAQNLVAIRYRARMRLERAQVNRRRRRAEWATAAAGDPKR
jgi:hypothetical protein